MNIIYTLAYYENIFRFYRIIILCIKHKIAEPGRVFPDPKSKLINQFINKTNDPNDNEFNLQDVLKDFTGNSNIGDLMGQFTGGDKGGLGEAIGGIFNKKK